MKYKPVSREQISNRQTEALFKLLVSARSYAARAGSDEKPGELWHDGAVRELRQAALRYARSIRP